LFSDILRTQLILKGIIADEDWSTIASTLNYDFLTDGHFAELKESEMMKDRIALLQSMESYIGKYFSNNYIRKNILKQSDRDIEDIDTQIEEEGSDKDLLDTQPDVKPSVKKSKPLV
jgi:glucan phosphorylase